MRLRISLFFIVGLLAVAPAHAEIYKCTDARGQVEFRNSPCGDNVPQEVIPETQPQIVTWDRDGKLRLKEESPTARELPADDDPSAVKSTGSNAPEATMSILRTTGDRLQALLAWLQSRGLGWGLGLVLVLYLVMSVVSFLAHRRDKRESTRRVGRPRRVPENTLHLQELFGGWPGALLAQRVYRHKTSKRDYQVEFWLIVGIHLLLWADYALGWPLLGALAGLFA